MAAPQRRIKKNERIYEIGNGRYLEASKSGDMMIIYDKQFPEKKIEFPMYRWATFVHTIDDIDKQVQILKDMKSVFYMCHIGGGYYVSVANGFFCVDLRKFYLNKDLDEIRASRSGIALKLKEWDSLKEAITKLHQVFPHLLSQVPCSQQSDHANHIAAMECTECYPFGPVAFKQEEEVN